MKAKFEELKDKYEELKPQVRERIRSAREKLEAVVRESLQPASYPAGREARFKYVNAKNKRQTELSAQRTGSEGTLHSNRQLLQILTYLTSNDFMEFDFKIEGFRYSFLRGITNSGRCRDIKTSKGPAAYGKCSLCNGKHPLIYGAESSMQGSSSFRMDNIYMICDEKAELILVKHLPLDECFIADHYLDGV